MRLRIRAMPTPLSESSPPDIAVRRTVSFGRLCRWSMLSCGVRMPVETLRKYRFACDEREEQTEERKESEAERRQTQGSSAVPSGTAAPGAPGAHLSAFHRGSRPKECFIARDSAPGFCFLGPGGTRFAHPLSGRYPPCPFQF